MEHVNKKSWIVMSNELEAKETTESETVYITWDIG
jgi:hypothetical protein